MPPQVLQSTKVLATREPDGDQGHLCATSGNRQIPTQPRRPSCAIRVVDTQGPGAQRSSQGETSFTTPFRAGTRSPSGLLEEVGRSPLHLRVLTFLGSFCRQMACSEDPADRCPTHRPPNVPPASVCPKCPRPGGSGVCGQCVLGGPSGCGPPKAAAVTR